MDWWAGLGSSWTISKLLMAIVISFDILFDILISYCGANLSMDVERGEIKIILSWTMWDWKCDIGLCAFDKGWFYSLEMVKMWLTQGY